MKGEESAVTVSEEGKVKVNEQNSGHNGAETIPNRCVKEEPERKSDKWVKVEKKGHPLIQGCCKRLWTSVNEKNTN